jgi:2'-5' RNA ligase
MATALRSFIALPGSDELQSALTSVVRRLAETPSDVRWERDASKFHITLRFLGNVEPDRLAELGTALAGHVVEVGALDLVYEGLGAFPSVERPRVVWAGVRANDALARLQAIVEQVCRRLEVGAPEERPFHPHITIGRVKGAHNLARLTATLKSITLEPVSARATHILLMRSELHPTGSRYTALKTLPLTS